MKGCHMSRYTNMHTKQYNIICKSQILSYLQRPVTTSGDSSLRSEWHDCNLWNVVISSASEGSPSLITGLSKADLQRTFFKLN